MKLITNPLKINLRRLSRYKYIKSLEKFKKTRNKDKLQKIFSLRFMKRMNIVSVKKRKSFLKRYLRLKNFIFKKRLSLLCRKNTFNLIFSIKSKNDYIKMKKEVGFSHLKNVNLNFWNIKKVWIKKIFKFYVKKDENHFSRIFSGKIIVMELENLKDIVKLLGLIGRKKAFCFGVYVFNQIYWPEYFLKTILNFSENLNKVGSILIVKKNIIHSIKNFINNMKYFLINGIKINK